VAERTNADVVRAVFAAWKERDREGALALIDPDIEVDVAGWTAILGYSGRGGGALDRTVAGWLDSWESLQFLPEHFIEAGDDVLVLLTMEGRGRGSGVPAQMRGVAVYTVHHGRVTALRGFATLAEAAAAAGV
jgi:ketosteroid isomerase-like protein